MFVLHSQAVLLFQRMSKSHRCFTVYAYLFQGNLLKLLAHPQLLSDSGLAVASSLAATRAISF